MNKHKLAEWLHDNYEQLAKANDWQTQEITRVKFDDLPAENKATMIALADKMLNTFLIISSNVLVMPSLPSVAMMDNCIEFAKWWRMWYSHPKVGTDVYGAYKVWSEGKLGNGA